MLKTSFKIVLGITLLTLASYQAQATVTAWACTQLLKSDDARFELKPASRRQYYSHNLLKNTYTLRTDVNGIPLAQNDVKKFYEAIYAKEFKLNEIRNKNNFCLREGKNLTSLLDGENKNGLNKQVINDCNQFLTATCQDTGAFQVPSQTTVEPNKANGKEKAQYVIEELFQHEDSYLDKIRIFIPASEVLAQIISEYRTGKTRFSLSPLNVPFEALMTNLKTIADATDGLTQNTRQARVSKSLTDEIKSLTHYKDYFEKMANVYQAYRKNFETITELMKTFDNSAQHKAFFDHIKHILILPVQQSARYPLLLKELQSKVLPTANTRLVDDVVTSAKKFASIVNSD